jgi:LuxR family transcriptional regulator, maltose regulon positive regulatory protein
MRDQAPRLAKLSTPRLARVLCRPRLFRRLDRARRGGVVWVVAQPGAGKTALVSSWLRTRRLRHAWASLDPADGEVPTFFHYLAMAARTGAAGSRRLPAFAPEYLAAPGAYARQFFRAYFAGARASSILVLDDYQEIRPGSPLHAALREGLAEVPRGAAVVVLSRAEPPPELAALALGGALELVKGEELGVTPAEAQGIAALWGYGGRDRAAVDALHARAEGWAAGLVLLLAAGQAGAQDGAAGEQRLVDYLAQEVFERAEEQTRRVLLETALLPTVTGAMAVALTGDGRAAEVLADLARRGYFLARHDQGYRFHALVREFLLGRAPRELGAARWSELKRTAARLLEAAGQVEDAVQLLVQEGAWDEACRVVRAEAPRALEKGRAEAVARWIGPLPAAVRERDPWLLALLGQALQLLEPRAAVEHLRRAFALFLEAGDSAGACLCWAVVSETLSCVLRDFPAAERWLSELEVLRERFRELGGPEVEPRLVAAAFGAVSMFRPTDPALAFWDQRALALSLAPGDPRWRMKLGQPLLLRHGAWVIDLAEARLVSEALRPIATSREADPFTAIHWHAGDAFHEFHSGRAEACREATERGLALAAETGLHQWDLHLYQAQAVAALLLGDVAAAERAVAGMEASRDRSSFAISAIFHATALLLARDRGDAAKAREHARIVRDLLGRFGDNPARYVFELECLLVEPPERVEAELGALASEARSRGVRFVEAGCLLALGMAARERGEDALALERLSAGLALKRELGCMGFAWFRPADLADCLALALEHGIETEYATAVIRAWQLRPGERAAELEAWPWALRIEALGGFAVLRGEEPLRSGRKEQRRPLELLRALVAEGPQGARQERVEEALWPEAEGDAAHHALGTTVYRLRRLLGSAEAVLHQRGRVALDPQVVFVDAWALERLLGRIDALQGRDGAAPAQLAALRQRARTLHRGELFGESDGVLHQRARERLAAHVARTLAVPDPE